MRYMSKINLILSVFLEVLLISDIVIALVTRKVSIASFVCIAIIAMLQIAINLINDYYNGKNKSA